MKYKIDCKSLLLQKALEVFLEDSLDENGLIISDYDGDFIIGKDIKKPFSKSQLLIQLEALYQKKQIQNKIEDSNKLEIDMSIFDDLMKKEEPKDILSFEQKLDNLIDEFSLKLKNLIKEEYGKK